MTQTTHEPVAAPAGAIELEPRPVVPRARLEHGSRLVVFFHALAFVIGFSAVFIVLGSLAGLLNQSLSQNPLQSRALIEDAMRRLGAMLVVLFALTTLGVFRWMVQWLRRHVDLRTNPAAAALVDVLEFFNNLLYTEKRMLDMHRVHRGWGYLSSGLLGVGFAAGWTPCVGPILGGIWLLAGSSATVGQGAALLAIYSLGLGIPFLITGAAFSSTTGLLRRINRHANIVSIISGLFLLYVAYLLWTDSLALMATRFAFLNEWVFRLEDAITAMSGAGGDMLSLSLLAAMPLAFLAGLISFISPCVLPLVPAYIGYLSGAALGGSRS
jgi:cytochrome c-type biogenesis protein